MADLYPEGVISAFQDKHRLFPQLYSFNVLFAFVAAGFFQLKDRHYEFGLGARMSWPCNEFDREVHFPLANVVETVVLDCDTQGIDFALTKRLSERTAPALASRKLQTVLPHVIGPLFTDFYETYRSFVARHSNPVWDFGRVVRNAASHDGRVFINNPKAASAAWHHIRLAPSDNGKPLICGLLEIGDLILLMMEMDRELDRLGAPLASCDWSA